MIVIMIALAMTVCACNGGDGKLTLTEGMIFCYDFENDYVYTGEEITFDPERIDVRVNGESVDIDLFEITYRDNVNAGTATVIITAKPENEYVTGSVEMHFNIVPDVGARCESSDDLSALLADPGVSGVMVWSDYTIPEGTTLTVPNGKTLHLIYGYRLSNYGTIVNDGTIVMRGALLSTGGRRTSEMTNYGTITNHGTFEIKDYGLLDDRGAFTSDGEITNLGKVYLRDEDKAFLKDGEGGVHYVRIPVTADHLTVAKCVYTQGYLDYTPEITTEARSARFSVAYEDNHHAGEARATVTMEDLDVYYYGAVTIPFTIEKGEATALSYDDLKDLILSEDYDTYTISSMIVTETFRFPKGKSLTVLDLLAVYGNFISEGDVTCSRVNVREGGKVTSDGLFTVTGTTFSINGTFTNGPNGDWSCSQGDLNVINIQRTGTFVNQGKVGEKDFGLSSGVLRNEGTITVTSTILGDFINSGEATIFGVYTAIYNGTFLNESTGKVTLQEAAYISTNFVNRGNFVNQGRISIMKYAEFETNGIFDNSQGEVYAFSAIYGINENVIIKKDIGSTKVDFQVEYLETPYNGKDQKPTFTVDGETLDPSLYSVKYRYLSATKETTECINIGEIEVIVSTNMKAELSGYGGNKSFNYRITPLTVHVTQTNFVEAAGNKNHDKLIMDEDVTLRGTVDIIEGCTLDQNGHKLIVKGGLRVYGTLICGDSIDPTSFEPSEEAACIVVEPSCGIYNFGRIRNSGFIYVKAKGYLSNMTNTSGSNGVIVNHGVIMAPHGFTTDVSSTGKLYARYNIDDIRYNFRFADNLVYTGEDQVITPTLIHNGESVDMSRFTCTVIGKSFYTGAAAMKITVNDLLDKDFFGEAEVGFGLSRGTIEVDSAASFKAAVANEGYKTISLIGNITLTEPVTLSRIQIVDLGDYEITFEGEGAVIYSDWCKLAVSANNEVRFLKYLYVADDITLTSDIGTAGVKTVIDFSDYRIAKYSGANYLSTVVHTNGHSFLGGLVIANSTIEGYTFEFENSSGNASTIGTEVGGYALVYGTSYKDTYVTLKNLTVYGVDHKGYSGTAQVADLSAENCTFLADREDQAAYAFRIWRVKASGTYTNCLFDGANAFFVDRGYKYDHSAGKTLPAYFFYNCTLKAYATPDYGDFHGNALTMDRTDSNLYVQIRESHFYSEEGNCIRVTTRTGVYLDVDNQTTFDHPEEKENILG